jgi:hypothetical protein
VPVKELELLVQPQVVEFSQHYQIYLSHHRADSPSKVLHRNILAVEFPFINDAQPALT